MKPVLIFEHIPSSNPGLFRKFLEDRSLPYRIIHVNEGESLPLLDQLEEYSGLCFLGGTESVTQATKVMLQEMDLIKHARKTGLPMIGHCLGGQLISKALGGEVKKNDVEEFGWSALAVCESREARQWLTGNQDEFHAMQWHSDTFSIPPGATRILSGEYCENQAFVLDNILAMQFHIEIDLDTIMHWALDLSEKHPPKDAGTQSGPEIVDETEHKCAVSSQLAIQLYQHWLEHLG